MTSAFSIEFQGTSPAHVALRLQIDRIAKLDATVLIYGEGGSSKEAVARTIHKLSGRRAGPFLCLNATAWVDIISELGPVDHERDESKVRKERSDALLEQVDGGTLFIDGVDTLPIKAQTALLRFLQGLSYRRVGSDRNLQIDVRLIAASSTDLQMLVEKRQFRKDLLYRLNVLSVRVPALP